MRRLLAIIFVVILLLTSYFIPVTSVFATEVIWGDNNTSNMTTTQYELFEKVAVMSMIPDLLSSGINELSIENANNVDDFVDNIIDYINTHAEDFTNINTWSALNDLNQAIKDKTIEIGNYMLNNGTVTQEYNGTLSSFFEPQNNNTTNYKNVYKANPNFVSIFNRLSRIQNQNPTPQPSPDFSFIQNINNFYVKRAANTGYPNTVSYYDTLHWYSYQGNGQTLIPSQPLTNYSYISDNFIGYHTYSDDGTAQGIIYNFATPITINVISQQDNTYSVVYSSYTKVNIDTVFPNIRSTGIGSVRWSADASKQSITISLDGVQTYVGGYIGVGGKNQDYTYNRDSFDDLSNCLNYIYQHYCNINLYVDGVPYALIPQSSSNISIDINGMDLYGGTDKPVTYYYPQGTQIDYQKLYMVIKHAIENETPISQNIINQGDTYYYNNNNYSPTIYNYYSDDDEDENDLINDLLTLAIVPEFDTALLEPIETPILNGEKIMFTGVQAFPDEILLVVGSAFVLILFGAMINRLIE